MLVLINRTILPSNNAVRLYQNEKKKNLLEIFEIFEDINIFILFEDSFFFWNLVFLILPWFFVERWRSKNIKQFKNIISHNKYFFLSLGQTKSSDSGGYV